MRIGHCNGQWHLPIVRLTSSFSCSFLIYFLRSFKFFFYNSGFYTHSCVRLLPSQHTHHHTPLTLLIPSFQTYQSAFLYLQSACLHRPVHQNWTNHKIKISQSFLQYFFHVPRNPLLLAFKLYCTVLRTRAEISIPIITPRISSSSTRWSHWWFVQSYYSITKSVSFTIEK